MLEVGKRVRHGFRNSRDMLEERPKVVSPHSPAEEEEIETITCHDIKKGGGKGMTPDPDMSLITDFQVVSDLSVSSGSSECGVCLVCMVTRL